MPYSRIKIDFDVTCLMVTALLTFFGLGRIEGLGIGTVAAAFTMGKGIVLMGKLLDKKFAFVSVLSPERPQNAGLIFDRKKLEKNVKSS